MTSSTKIWKEFGGKIVSPNQFNSRNVYSEDSGIYKHSFLQNNVGNFARDHSILAERV